MTEMTPIPKLDISDAALQQIILIQRHDYTLAGLSFRVKIGGKGCNGFTYELGFSSALPDDVVVSIDAPGETNPVQIHMDPFTAFYTQLARLDHSIDPETQDEGFLLTNLNEGLYRGKFYKDTTLVPPWEKA